MNFTPNCIKVYFVIYKYRVDTLVSVGGTVAKASGSTWFRRKRDETARIPSGAFYRQIAVHVARWSTAKSYLDAGTRPPLAENARQKQRIAKHVASREAPWLVREPINPFHSCRANPGRGALGVAGHEIE